MSFLSAPIARLIEEFEKFPGIGHKTAQRLAFHVLDMPVERVEAFAKVITDAKHKTKYCSSCGNLTDSDPCYICNSPTRDHSVICVVEDARAIIAIERMREFKGVYHVLHGTISPMEGIGPNDINIKGLISRLNGTVREVIMATNPNIEGEATSMYISKIVKPLGVKTTRIAHGVPVGGDLEYADEVTLSKALDGRKEL